eukprot:Selendium_serpulae@DN6093_c2_g2_i10.p1
MFTTNLQLCLQNLPSRFWPIPKRAILLPQSRLKVDRIRNLICKSRFDDSRPSPFARPEISAISMYISGAVGCFFSRIVLTSACDVPCTPPPAAQSPPTRLMFPSGREAPRNDCILSQKNLEPKRHLSLTNKMLFHSFVLAMRKVRDVNKNHEIKNRVHL